MTYITLPDERQRTLPFYLAMEEYVAKHLDEDDCFFMWQVSPTVIFGRNQLIENEVNLAYCRAHHIQTYRRKSGGGCVYADMGNIMLSYITKDEHVNFTFNRYINLVALMLCRLGIEASSSGRNDILIDGRKVSGNAFYHLPGRSIVHGTLLYDTNMEHMTGSLTPSTEKLATKGVDSVRQHITLLKDHITLGIDGLMRHIRQTICDKEMTLSEDAIPVIEQIQQSYLSDEFIFGNNPSYSLLRQGHISGVGHFEVRLRMKNGIIKDANILGDFFLIGDLEEGILSHLRGCHLDRASLDQALPAHLDKTILHLNKDQLISIIINNE